MKKSHLALGGCFVSFALTIMVHFSQPAFFQGEVQEVRPDYRQIFSTFFASEQEQKEEKASTLLVVSNATWCAPCKKLHPILEKLQEQGYDVTIVTPKKYAKRHKSKKVPIDKLPTLLFENDKGKIILKAVGFKTESYIKKRLKKNEKNTKTFRVFPSRNNDRPKL